MTSYHIYSLLAVIGVSLVSLIGVVSLAFKDEYVKKYIGLFISLAIGALLGDAFIHIIPESFENLVDPNITSLLIISGLMIFFLLEKLIHWHHHGEDKEEEHVHPVGKLVLFSDGIHNLIDGIIIGVSFIVSIPLGFATTLAVILHEIPQEIGDFAVLLHAGYSKRKALLYNFISALFAVLGVLIVFILGDVIENYILWFLPIAAGGFIYVALADLIPELHKHSGRTNLILQIGALTLGVLLMLSLKFIE